MREIWRQIPFHIGSSQEHFETSDALVRATPVPTLWWHSADRPTLILGAGQVWSDEDARRCSRAGVIVVRRHSGGTGVLAVPGVLGLDVALPKTHHLVSEDVVQGYRWLGETWLEAVRKLGVDGRLVGIEEARRSAQSQIPNLADIRLACFGTLSPYEVAVSNRKLVGLAQVRRQAGILLQSALHIHFDVNALVNLLPVANRTEVAEALDSVATGLDRVSPRAAQTSEVMRAFEQSLTDRYGIELQVAQPEGPPARCGSSAAGRAG